MNRILLNVTHFLSQILARGVPDYDYQFGYLKFDRSIKPISDRVAEIDSAPTEEETFQGQGFSMKKSRKWRKSIKIEKENMYFLIIINNF